MARNESENESELGVIRREDIYNQYIGQWMLFKSHNDWEAGRLDRIKEGYIILNPYQGADLEGKSVNTLVEEDAGVRLDTITSYRVISKKLILANCEGQNKRKIKPISKIRLILKEFLRL